MSTIQSSNEHLTINASGAGKELRLQNNGTTNVTVDTSGNALFNTTDVDANIGGASGSTQVALRTSSEGLRISQTGASYWNRYGDGELLKFRRAGVDVGSIDVNASGASIKLGGTAAANALDDYEEGTWTPTNITSGTVGYAKYTKIGDVVTISLEVSGSITLGSSLIGGLPYSARTTSAPWYFSNFALTTGYVPMSTIAGTTLHLRRQSQSTGAWSTLSDLTGSYISITATYHI